MPSLLLLLVLGTVSARATLPARQAQQHAHHPTRQTTRRQNVLYIIVDDLRPELGYSVPNGNHHISTPNVDALAAKSMIFDRAYVQQGVSVRLATMLVFRLLLTQTTRDVRGNRIGVRPHAEQFHDFPSPRHHARVELSD